MHMRYNHCEECNCSDLCPYTKYEYEDLILHAAYVIADLNKEIIGLKYALKDKYPEIMDDIYLDIDETIENNDLFIDVQNNYPFPVFDKHYRVDLHFLSERGYSWNGTFPKSIRRIKKKRKFDKQNNKK